MNQSKRPECPRIKIVQAAELKFKTRDEAWQVVGPILARLLAQTISAEKQQQEQKSGTPRQRCPKTNEE